MNCEDFKEQLDQCFDGELADIEQLRLGRHLETCADCRAALEAARAVRRGMTLLPAADPPEGFAGRVIGNAVARAERHQSRQRLRIGGIAAVLALCAIVAGYLPGGPDADPAAQATVTLDENVKMVRLAIDSEESVDTARLTITLSDNLGIEGYGSRRTLTWNTSLKAGVNMLSLPVYAIALGEGKIAASLEIGEGQKEFIVLTKNPGAAMPDDFAGRISA